MRLSIIFLFTLMVGCSHKISKNSLEKNCPELLNIVSKYWGMYENDSKYFCKSKFTYEFSREINSNTCKNKVTKKQLVELLGSPNEEIDNALDYFTTGHPNLDKSKFVTLIYKCTSDTKVSSGEGIINGTITMYVLIDKRENIVRKIFRLGR